MPTIAENAVVASLVRGSENKVPVVGSRLRVREGGATPYIKLATVPTFLFLAAIAELGPIFTGDRLCEVISDGLACFRDTFARSRLLRIIPVVGKGSSPMNYRIRWD